MSERTSLDKDFDDPEVRGLPPFPFAELWSDEACEVYGDFHDTPEEVGRWFSEHKITPVLDVGCGPGPFRKAYDGKWFGLDRSIEQLKAGEPGPVVIGDGLQLPYADETFEGVVANYVLYFFDDPSQAVAEAKRVLRPGGWFSCCAPSRYDAPEFHHVLPPEVFDESFASEDIPDVMSVFDDVEINYWDLPMFDILNREIAAAYLAGWYYPRIKESDARRLAEQIDVPLKLTKRGAWAVGRKRKSPKW